jgi:hypothetical protein
MLGSALCSQNIGDGPIKWLHLNEGKKRKEKKRKEKKLAMGAPPHSLI